MPRVLIPIGCVKAGTNDPQTWWRACFLWTGSVHRPPVSGLKYVHSAASYGGLNTALAHICQPVGRGRCWWRRQISGCHAKAAHPISAQGRPHVGQNPSIRMFISGAKRKILSCLLIPPPASFPSSPPAYANICPLPFLLVGPLKRRPTTSEHVYTSPSLIAIAETDDGRR